MKKLNSQEINNLTIGKAIIGFISCGLAGWVQRTAYRFDKYCYLANNTPIDGNGWTFDPQGQYESQVKEWLKTIHTFQFDNQ